MKLNCDQLYNTKEKIELMRDQLQDVVINKDKCFQEPETIALSQALDELILEYIKKTKGQ